MRTCCPSLFALAVSAVLAAQAAPVAPLSGDAIGLDRGEHRVEFTAGHRRFVHGPAALQWQPATVRRGGGMPVAFAPVPPRDVAGAVHYEHAVCTERYEPRPDGVELSFVFARLPAGDGDLTVRLAATTTAPVRRSGPHGLVFGDRPATAIVWGGVTGIAADGARATGTITWDGTGIELTLPAAFVATAALPLVLDPAVGTTVSAGFGFRAHPDVAGLVTLPGTACCAYEYDPTFGTPEIRARWLAGVGNPLGAEFTIAPDGTSPAIAAVLGAPFVICAYQRNGGVMVRTVDSSGNNIALTMIAGSAETPDIGGGSATSGDGLCVYHDTAVDAIRARPFTVAPTGAVSFGAVVTIATASTFVNLARPRISKSAGADGRHLVAWESTNAIAAATTVHIAAVSTAGTVLGSLSLGAGSAIDVDGDGRQWIAVFQRAGASGDDDVMAVAVSWPLPTATLVASPAVPVTALANVNERAPAVCWLRQSALVGWERSVPASTDTDLFVKTIDPFTCAQCQPAELLVNTTNPEDQLALAPVAVDGTFGAAMVWRYGATGNSISYTEFRNDDGTLLSLFGQNPCLGGVTASGCPRVGNNDFRVRLRDALPNAPSWLVLSPQAASLSCGCTLVADPFQGFLTGGAPTTAQGQAEALLAIPNSTQLSGLNFLAQWIVASPTGACSLIGADFSTAAILVLR